MSMASDILDVLNVNKETRNEHQQKKKKHIIHFEESANKRKKIGAMNRELANLMGPNLAPINITHHQPNKKFKDRLTDLQTIQPSWTLTPFTNGSRSDGLQLKHWVKGKLDLLESKKPYIYEKYNTSLDIPDFTEDDYNKLLKDINPDWSYKETKYLFDLAKRYDLRWAVIIDSYEKIKR
ncbi:unnamed protein product [Ambrosiozyma monospora]|uniref:Unnamed protein product n=1 Tax=Ambrosiozyma monospora TaxID=43982 RepID=A0ACB5TS27_AMBMO|nr:unnamed protein product [Ambrosiozyma monospora]